MNNWIFPSVVAALVSALLLNVVYFYTWLEQRERHVRLWTLGWILYSLRFFFTLAMIVQGPHPVLAAAELLSTVASSVFLFEGTYIFCGRTMHRGWGWGTAATVVCWSLVANSLGLPFMVATVPAFFFMGLIQIYIGLAFLRSVELSRSRIIAGVPMIVWGLHKFDYPFLRYVEWFAPWGFLLGTFCAVMAAMGFLLTSMKRFSNTAKEKDRRYRRIVENAADGVYLADSTGRLIDVNKAACQLLGYTRDELLALNVWDVDPSTSPEKNREHWAEFSLEKVETYETIHLRKDGTPLNVEIRLCLFEESGERYVLGLGRDITERKEAEAALQAEAARRKSLMDISYDGIAIFNQDHHIIEANTRFLDNLGYTREELPSLRTWDFEMAMTEEEIRSKFSEFSRMHSFFETRHKRKDGTIYDAEVSIGGAIIHDEPLLFTITRDISERKRIEEALKTSEQRFRSLLESVDMVAVHGYDENRKAIYWNTASERLYGYSREEVLGLRLEDLVIPKSMHDKVIRLVTDWMDHGKPIPPGELDLFRKDGSPISVYSSHVMQKNASGNKEIYFIDVELTDIKRAHDQLLKAKEEAESANRIKSEFLANMSHEIRTPLNGILGMLQLMRLCEMEDEATEYAATAVTSCKRLSKLLGDILDLSRIEAGGLSILHEPLDVRDMIDSVEKLFGPSAMQSGIHLQTHVDDRIPDILLGDANRLQQVLNNLVGNAIKFTDSGTIKVEAYPLTTERKNCCRILFEVSDTGIGFPDHMIETLYQPFTQADGSYTRKYGGAGLGLSITKRLLDLMGGTISVASEPGTGTTFHFCLTFDISTPASALPPEDHANGNMKTFELKLLIVEDDVVNQLAIKRLTEKMGCNVTAAGNGKMAIDLLSTGSYDLVFMDVQMPVMGGVEATKAIRRGDSGEKNKHIPIIALTAFAMDDDKEKFLSAGMDEYLAKPVDIEQLQEVLQRAVDQATE